MELRRERKSSWKEESKTAPIAKITRLLSAIYNQRQLSASEYDDFCTTGLQQCDFVEDDSLAFGFGHSDAQLLLNYLV